MKIKQLTGIFISQFNDSVLGITYGKILTNETLESVRFPTLLENYKYRHLIQPNHLVTIEVIKTSKNWVVKSVLSHQEIYKPIEFGDFLILCEAVKSLKENIKEEQRTDILTVILNYFQSIKKINIADFNLIIAKNMGF